MKINKLIMKNCGNSLTSTVIKQAHYEGRYTGETTGYLLKFLGEVISNPNKRLRIRDSYYGYRDRKFDFNTLKVLVMKLELDFIKFYEHDLSVEFDLYEDYKDEFDMYLKLRGSTDD